MHRLILMLLCTSLLYLLSCAITGEYDEAPNINKLDVSFADSEWTGIKIPKEHRCHIEGGDGFTPRLTVKNIPPEANALIIEYTLGGLGLRKQFYGYFGIIGYEILQGTSEIIVPSVPANTFSLPDRFFLVSIPQPAMSHPGAYCAPCGKHDGYNYLVKIRAVYRSNLKDQKSKIIGKGDLSLGRD